MVGMHDVTPHHPLWVNLNLRYSMLVADFFQLASMQDRPGSRMLWPVDLRCLIVDDNNAFCAAATSLLNRDGVEVVGAAHTIQEALQKATELRPDIYLVDIDLDGQSGFDLARRICASADLQPSSVVLTSSYSESDFGDLIVASPAAGFLAKSRLSAAALREAASGSPGT